MSQQRHHFDTVAQGTESSTSEPSFAWNFAQWSMLATAFQNSANSCMVPAAEYGAMLCLSTRLISTSCSTMGLSNDVQSKVSLLLQKCLKYSLLKVRILVI